jgi:flagellar assembly protein FliH
MGVVKPSVTRKHLQDAIVLDLGDLRARADALCEEARATAHRTVEDAKDERERLISGAREEGYAKGFDEGRTQGLEEGRAEGENKALEEASARLDALRNAYQQALDDYTSERQRMLSSAREDILTLACELAKRVALRTVELDETVVERRLERVLELAIEPTRVVLRVHPDDRETVERALPALLDRFAESPHARIAEDDTLARGSCVLRTDRGEIDASVTTMLDEIVGALLPDKEGDA